MSFSVSPAVTVQEVDQTSIIPAVATSVAAIAGVFAWGPAYQPVLVASEGQLRQQFGNPTTAFNLETWFTASSYLAYSTALWVTRAVDANTFNAVAAPSSTANVQIQNETAHATATMPAGAYYVAKYPGSKGNSLTVSICDSANAFQSTTSAPSDANNTVIFTFTPGSKSGTMVVTNSQGATGNTSAAADAATLAGDLTAGDWVSIGNTSTGTQRVQIKSIGTPVTTGNGISTTVITIANTPYITANAASSSLTRQWEFYNQVSGAPGTSDGVAAAGGTGDELHVVVIDKGGKFTGVPGSVLEVFDSVSRATDAKDSFGNTNYYKNVIDTQSQYMWWAGDVAGAASANSSSVVASTNYEPTQLNFARGTDSADETTVDIGSIQSAYLLYQDPESIDIGLVIAGSAQSATLPNYIIDNICETRLDCMAFISPTKADVVNNAGSEATDIIAFRNSLSTSSYAVLDSGYKYMYDQYNDQYVWVPLNGDIAGLCARTDYTNDPWWSPAGYNRGQIKNVVKLAYNPSKTDRDLLYPSSVNPVVSFPGQGTVLFGDKTLLAKPSAFDRINVRRLFIVLEKAIATAAKYMLFEFNDTVTRQNFVNMTTPYLRDIQGRRGLTSFQVICDESNNPPQVVDSNEFVGNVMVVPTYSINFINLIFTAENGSVTFTEQTGAQVS